MIGRMDELTIFDLRRRMAAGELTAAGLTALYLARIAELDRAGPALNSVIELNPDALTIADALDAERAARGPRGPLHGIPILLKDNIDTHDQMSTTAGSLALVGSTPLQDATVAARLRKAGAILLGKTNLSEWANFRSNHSTSGWSSRGGLTKNPYALDRNPCGSSSGSGAAVAANLCAAAVGTETDGSIICPSHANGIVGIKPTMGLVSRAGIVPISHSQDTAGPMARTVADAAILLGPLAGPDPRDAATESCRERALPDYTAFLDPDGLAAARIGVARNFFGRLSCVDRIAEESIAVLADLGAEIVDDLQLCASKELDNHEFEVLLYEFKADLNAYLAGLGPAAPVHSLEEVIAFNRMHADRVMPYFDQELMVMALAKGPLSEDAYRTARETSRRLARAEGIDALLGEHRLDAIVAPSGGPAWLTDLVNGDHYTGCGSSSPAAVAGYPSITVPAGTVFGLPIGISFIGGAFSEATLIKFAYAFEQATNARQTPAFLPSVNL
ncbi:MAG: amidase [Chloroflexi bacterium]|nr:amidase [Chloroflexota bacterium]